MPTSLPPLPDRAEAEPANPGAKLLFALVGLFYWITLTPFPDLSIDPVLVKPAGWSQMLAAILFLVLIAHALQPQIRGMVMRPRAFLCLLFGWFVFTAAVSPDMASALKRIMIAMTVTVSASIFLLLPRDERQFARLAGAGVMLILGLCYLGVLAFPTRAIHQTNDFLEPQHAGHWRGLYMQKNEAGVAMVLISFVGLYVASSWSKRIGYAIVAAAVFFLLHTGAKTSMGMLPAMLVLAALVERFPVTRLPIVFGGVALLNLLTIGVVAIRPIRDFVQSLGIDATYTARADIWLLGLDAIAQRPITGYGFDGFWQTPELKNSTLSIATWAVKAVDAHNAYLDAAINAGLPGLLLMLVWVLYLPLRHVAKAQERNNFNALARLFLRVWLYSIFLAGLESVFMTRSGPVWFSLCVAMFGLGYQARCRAAGVRSIEHDDDQALAQGSAGFRSAQGQG
ncbi:O-antigen ligase [Rhizobium sp. RU35A]|uniref:O-antigen ligase family protein n=1 Tax=Rhizobium sp. RU35A TaxID=1907414 RepID=UPI000954140F|nr:O-antigen ligase [Rhizobium sp. RU35A]SIQ93922.1 O-antigen ligase [Rhizobium sp. RU35A]